MAAELFRAGWNVSDAAQRWNESIEGPERVLPILLREEGLRACVRQATRHARLETRPARLNSKRRQRRKGVTDDNSNRSRDTIERAAVSNRTSPATFARARLQER